MEIEVSRLVPGMVLHEDVVGRSGKTIVPKDTPLTKTHIEFMEQFLIEKVSIPPSLFNIAEQEINDTEVTLADFAKRAISQYKQMFATWKNNVPINMYEVRRIFMPFFEQVVEEPLNDIYVSFQSGPIEDQIYYEHVLSTVTAIHLAKELYEDKKDWLQVGFAAILSHSGKAKLKVIDANNDDYPLYPLYSYRMVESITTLTKQAKVAVLQHQERLDGSGFPTQVTDDKIHPFAQIIGLGHLYSEQHLVTNREKLLFIEEQANRFDTDILHALKNVTEK